MDTSQQLASALRADAETKTVLGLLGKPLVAGIRYKIRVAGVMNPRFASTSADDTKWTVKTYDSELDPSLDPVTFEDTADSENLIDEGRGG